MHSTRSARTRTTCTNAAPGFVFTCKQNQPRLFAALDALAWAQVPAVSEIQRGHGRVTTRNSASQGRIRPSPCRRRGDCAQLASRAALALVVNWGVVAPPGGCRVVTVGGGAHVLLVLEAGADGAAHRGQRGDDPCKHCVVGRADRPVKPLGQHRRVDEERGRSGGAGEQHQVGHTQAARPSVSTVPTLNRRASSRGVSPDAFSHRSCAMISHPTRPTRLSSMISMSRGPSQASPICQMVLVVKANVLGVVQRRRRRLRCQIRIVAGVIRNPRRRRAGSSRPRAAITARSVQLIRGRGVRRCRTAS
jgi:hypothetical protein